MRGLSPYIPVSGDVYGTPVHVKVSVWEQFRVGFLRENMRASSDPPFAELLESVAMGNATEDVIQALDSRRILRDQDGQQSVDPNHPCFKA